MESAVLGRTLGAMSARGSDRRDRTGVAVLCAASVLAAAAAMMLVSSADIRVLRLAVVATLWAFLLVAIWATHRQGGRPLPGGEVELRRAYEVELAREVAARREYELRLEVQLRRDLEGALREDVDALRRDLVALHRRIVDSLDGEPGEHRTRTALRAESTRLSDGGRCELAGDGAWLVTDEQDLPIDGTEIPNEAVTPVLSSGVVLRWLTDYPPKALDAAALPDLRGRSVDVWSEQGTAGNSRDYVGVGSVGGTCRVHSAGRAPGIDSGTGITSGFQPGEGCRGGRWNAEHNRAGRDMYGHNGQAPSGHEDIRQSSGAATGHRNGDPSAEYGMKRGNLKEGAVEGDIMEGDTGNVPRINPQSDPDARETGDVLYGSPTSQTSGQAGGTTPPVASDEAVRNAEGAPPEHNRADAVEARASRKDDEVSGEIVESTHPERDGASVYSSAAQPVEGQPESDGVAKDAAAESAHGRHYRGDDDTGTFVRMLGGRVDAIAQPRHRRYREDDEENEVLTRILGR